MGSEHSHQSSAAATAAAGAAPAASSRPTGYPERLQRANTVAATGITRQSTEDGSAFNSPSESRPVSPPMSICSDSDLPYISYTDKPIGDSPKLRNKGGQPGGTKLMRPNSMIAGGSGSSGSTGSRHSLASLKSKSNRAVSSNIVVVRQATKQESIDKDPDLIRLQSIPQFLPVMRSTLSLPANRDPEILERLQPIHLNAMCSRLQTHFNACANEVAADQQKITQAMKEIDQAVTVQHTRLVEKQKLYSSYAETFSKVRQISQTLSRCNALLNENIESLETLNNFLPVEHRLEPFVWQTG